MFSLGALLAGCDFPPSSQNQVTKFVFPLSVQDLRSYITAAGTNVASIEVRCHFQITKQGISTIIAGTAYHGEQLVIASDKAMSLNATTIHLLTRNNKSPSLLSDGQTVSPSPALLFGDFFVHNKTICVTNYSFHPVRPPSQGTSL
jgi:hypothetical protein